MTSWQAQTPLHPRRVRAAGATARLCKAISSHLQPSVGCSAVRHARPVSNACGIHANAAGAQQHISEAGCNSKLTGMSAMLHGEAGAMPQPNRLRTLQTAASSQCQQCHQAAHAAQRTVQYAILRLAQHGDSMQTGKTWCRQFDADSLGSHTVKCSCSLRCCHPPHAKAARLRSWVTLIRSWARLSEPDGAGAACRQS